MLMFDERFEVVLADTARSKAIHYQLRYQVFCLEKGFENAQQFKNEMEQDRYDDQAVHFLVRDKKRNKWVGAARLVLGTADSLPLKQVAEFQLPDLPADKVIAEFSRLLILDEYRQPNGNGSSEPEILLGLIRAAKEYCQNVAAIEHWVFLCRRSLCRMLTNVGIDLRQIGPACAFRGIRIPYRMDLATAFNEIAHVSFRTYQMLNRPRSHYPHFIAYSELVRRYQVA
ncbi:PEP-CTERM/exosortase system-associated acyltransferase [Candidatus Methylocalor cossyra]|uniref:Acyl-homoserine-lactone synthase n=1 Tax=Candidatus Methylocalor cossyra TaxID=3108543 RepID=A0ABM9NJI6_9GAMM